MLLEFGLGADYSLWILRYAVKAVRVFSENCRFVDAHTSLSSHTRSCNELARKHIGETRVTQCKSRIGIIRRNSVTVKDLKTATCGRFVSMFFPQV